MHVSSCTLAKEKKYFNTEMAIDFGQMNEWQFITELQSETTDIYKRKCFIDLLHLKDNKTCLISKT